MIDVFEVAQVVYEERVFICLVEHVLEASCFLTGRTISELSTNHDRDHHAVSYLIPHIS